MSNGPTNWLSVNANGLLIGTPTNDDVGVNEFTVEVRDSAGAFDQKSFSLIINNINDAPVLEPDYVP